MVLSLLVAQGLHGLHGDLEDPLSQEVPEGQVLLLDPDRMTGQVTGDLAI